MKRGDIIVNPWVSKEYCGYLNPMYATVYIGNNKSVDYKGRVHSWADKVYSEKNVRGAWKVIGHYDFFGEIEKAIKKAAEEEEG